MGFTRRELEAARGRSVPDLVGDDVRLLFVGINPGLWTAAAQAHFAHPGNRFWKALHRAGLVDHPIDASGGLSAEDARALVERGIGITNLVNRATARADELDPEELRGGARELVEKIRRLHPKVVVVLGLGAYRTGFGRPRARRGRQPEPLDGAILYVAGNPSGLNAHETVDSLAGLFAEAAREAGIPLEEPR
ncbi:MAG TPA: mismatch-specific DNA-glycosylase [Actinobacteria bacterium]|nr:mismatch-specific DNA-glycosylase [Actinomycetota bacterium]